MAMLFGIDARGPRHRPVQDVPTGSAYRRRQNASRKTKPSPTLKTAATTLHPGRLLAASRISHAPAARSHRHNRAETTTEGLVANQSARMRKTVGHIKAVDAQRRGAQGRHARRRRRVVARKTRAASPSGRRISSDGPLVFMGNPLQELRFKERRPQPPHMHRVCQDPTARCRRACRWPDIIHEVRWLHMPHIPRALVQKRFAKAWRTVGLDPDRRFAIRERVSPAAIATYRVALPSCADPTFVVFDDSTSALAC